MLIFAPLLLAATIESEPVARTSSLSAAIASAHCATLRIDAHPRARIALVSRICLRPGESEVVEERGIVNLDARRFTFVRAPFNQVDDDDNGYPPSCFVIEEERMHDAIARDPVSRVLRDPRIAPCLLARAASGDHVLWRWRGDLLDPNNSAPDGHPLVSWSKSGRLVALHHLTPNFDEHVVVVESTVIDTRSLEARHDGEDSGGVYVPRFRGEIAEVIVNTGGGVESWLVDFRTSPETMVRRGMRLAYSEMAIDVRVVARSGEAGATVEGVDVTTFRGFFDEATCRRARTQ